MHCRLACMRLNCVVYAAMQHCKPSGMAGASEVSLSHWAMCISFVQFYAVGGPGFLAMFLSGQLPRGVLFRVAGLRPWYLHVVYFSRVWLSLLGLVLQRV